MQQQPDGPAAPVESQYLKIRRHVQQNAQHIQIPLHATAIRWNEKKKKAGPIKGFFLSIGLSILNFLAPSAKPENAIPPVEPQVIARHLDQNSYYEDFLETSSDYIQSQNENLMETANNERPPPQVAADSPPPQPRPVRMLVDNPFVTLAHEDFVHRLGPIVERTVNGVRAGGGTAYVANVLAALHTEPAELTPAYRRAREDLAVLVSAAVAWEARNRKLLNLTLVTGILERIWRKVEACKRLAPAEASRSLEYVPTVEDMASLIQRKPKE